MPSLRTLEGKKKYQEYLKNTAASGVCSLCGKDALKVFAHWRIVDNSFPYDQIAKVHEMLVPNRHCTEPELTEEELGELRQIKAEFVNSNYDWILEATTKNKSVPGHFHLHLLVGKERVPETLDE